MKRQNKMIKRLEDRMYSHTSHKHCAFAFTMAEILITLTIIGVIAALTLPTLTADITAKQYATTYKKAYATIDQALKMGSADSKDASTECANAGGTATTRPTLTLGDILIENIGAKYINTDNKTSSNPLWNIKAPLYSTWSLNNTNSVSVVSGAARTIPITNEFQVFMLKDGLSYLIVREPVGNRCFGAGKPVFVGNSVDFTGRYCEAYIDVNGAKGPNTVITCANQGNTDVMPTNAPFTVDFAAERAVNCQVSESSIMDIFPVVIYDDKIIPGTPAAAAILQDK